MTLFSSAIYPFQNFNSTIRLGLLMKINKIQSYKNVITDGSMIKRLSYNNYVLVPR